MKRCIGFFLLIIITIANVQPSLAKGVHGRFWLGGMGLFLDYTEKEGSTVLDRDHGWLPGVDSGFLVSERNWVFIFKGKYASTTTATYDGQTQGGVPVSFDHKYETIWTVEADIGYTFHAAIECTPYVGLGYRRWRRGKAQLVQAADGSYAWDYKEVYRWGYVPLGVILEKSFLRKRLEITVDTAILFPFAQHMTSYDSEINPSYSDVTFDLGWRPGFKIEVPIHIYFTSKSKTAFYIKPIYRYWNIGRSNTVVANGGLYWEPHSITHYYGVSCGVVFRF